jgi:exosortase A
MDTPEAEALVERSPAVAGGSGVTAWKLCLSVLALSLGALLLVYFDTFRSMAAIWSRSDTYVHGYFVLPISLYLIWTLRAEVSKLSPRADARALAPIALAGVGFVAARLGGVLVAEQYFAVASVPLMVWAVAGPSVVRRLLFPLGYLLLMVPVGEALIPYLIDYTAAFAVAALRVTGVPVLQEGNLLTLPNSQWSVVEACSGLRYLIACITIGLVFAYLTYRSWTRRALFIGLSIVVPIVANWIRAYLIVFIGYTSDMELAVGVDHLIYGWIFYALVMVLLLWVGSLFSDERAPEERETLVESAVVRPSPIGRTVFIACAAVLGAAVWPVWAGYADSRAAVGSSIGIPFEFPERIGAWTYRGDRSPWEPRYVGASFTGVGIYEAGGSRVGLHVALYPDQRQGAELVSSANSLVDRKDGGWRQRSLEGRGVALHGGQFKVGEDSHRARPRAPRLEVVLDLRPSHVEPGLGEGDRIERSSGSKTLRRWVVVFTEADDEESARARLGVPGRGTSGDRGRSRGYFPMTQERRPLIAHVIHRLHVGGMENGLVNLINRMPEDRYRHAVVSLTDSTSFADRISRADVPIVSLGKKPGQDPGLHWRLFRAFRRLRPTIVHRNLSAVEAVASLPWRWSPIAFTGSTAATFKTRTEAGAGTGGCVALSRPSSIAS